MKAVRLSFVFCLLVQAACTIGPDFEAPEVTISSEWSDKGENQIEALAIDQQ